LSQNRWARSPFSLIWRPLSQYPLNEKPNRILQKTVQKKSWSTNAALRTPEIGNENWSIRIRWHWNNTILSSWDSW
jgi:hypothetical protein